MNSGLRCKRLPGLVVILFLPMHFAAAQQAPSRPLAEEMGRRQNVEREVQQDRARTGDGIKRAEQRRVEERRAEREVARHREARASSSADVDSASESSSSGSAGATGMSGAEREGVRDPCLTNPNLPHCK